MKNTLKYLSILAASGSFLLGTLNVNAEKTCEPGETVHTDYIMMLDARTPQNLKDEIADFAATATGGALYTQTNKASKYNNIKGQTIIDEGQIGITYNKVTTNTNATVSWTAQEFWKKYYYAFRGNNAANESNNWVYTKGSEHFLMHDKWTMCGQDTDCKNPVNKEPLEYLQDTRAGLLNFLADVVGDEDSSNGNTSEMTKFLNDSVLLPDSTITQPQGYDTSKDLNLPWKVDRTFGNVYDESKIGRNFNNNNNTVFAPAAYFIKYCVADSGTPSASKTITYDKNTDDPVSNVPVNQPFTDECTSLSDKTPIREGYRFVAWSKETTAVGQTWKPSDRYCGDSIVLHAIWEENATNTKGTYTVTYDANGGKNAPASDTKDLGTCATISSNKPTLTGNKFLGWSPSKDAKEPDSNYKAGESYCKDKNITLYAVWQPVTGISAHMIAFGVVAIAAGAALIVAKKKDLFRQI